MSADTRFAEESINSAYAKPLFFKQNRVFRNYVGGAGLAVLTGDGSTDGNFPEEWIASKVKAINPVYFGERDGVSVTEDGEYLDNLLEKEATTLLGRRQYDCLVKYLDSAIRLPVQVHPTPDFSKKHFGSPYGKTEAWLVLAKRDDNAKLYFGFKEKTDAETLKNYADRSLEERDILTELITPVEVNVGDVYLINAGLIHAIGAGCTILEVQEPTDFTIQIENWCGESRVTEQEKYLGLERDTAISIFDFDKFGEQAVKAAKITPETLYCDDNIKIESLIDYNDTPCFAEKRYTLKGGSTVMGFGPCVWTIVQGEGCVCGENYHRNVRKGDYFFLPYAAQGKFSLAGNLVAVECLPGRQD